MIYIISILIFLLDQCSKYIILQTFYLGESKEIVPDIFHITYLLNTGTAFSLFTGRNTLFIIFTLTCIICILLFRSRLFPPPAHKNWKKVLDIGLGFLLGGAFGNVIDRIFRGSVVDFLDFRIWPVFNIADSAICVAVFLLALVIWKGK